MECSYYILISTPGSIFVSLPGFLAFQRGSYNGEGTGLREKERVPRDCQRFRLPVSRDPVQAPGVVGKLCLKNIA